MNPNFFAKKFLETTKGVVSLAFGALLAPFTLRWGSSYEGLPQGNPPSQRPPQELTVPDYENVNPENALSVLGVLTQGGEITGSILGHRGNTDSYSPEGVDISTFTARSLYDAAHTTAEYRQPVGFVDPVSSLATNDFHPYVVGIEGQPRVISAGLMPINPGNYNQCINEFERFVATTLRENSECKRLIVPIGLTGDPGHCVSMIIDRTDSGLRVHIQDIFGKEQYTEQKLDLFKAVDRAGNALGISNNNIYATCNPQPTWNRGGPCGVMAALFNKDMMERALEGDMEIPNVAPFSAEGVEYAYMIHDLAIGQMGNSLRNNLQQQYNRAME
ncbi:MAG: hypothetical protein ACK5O1_03455 [Holosporales bacterium]